MITTTPPPPTHRRSFVAPLLLVALAAISPLSAQIKPAPAPAPAAPEVKSKPIAVETKTPDAAKSEDVVVLSPFEVVADTKGYFAANTMSGTRMNSKIEDLGQSITVMTKEQMSDFGMLDINDVFDHMAGTEGTNSYSQFDTDRTGAVVDQVNLNPNNANRVRGISNANIAFNNIATTGRVPVDPLWMDAFELSRGPNANIFGLGNASGTVNQVPATANVYRDFTNVQVRGDSYGGWRGSIDTNRVLVKDKVAIRASYAKEHIGFIRKPSGEDQRRLSFQVKVKPAKNTTISLSYFGFKDSSVRPNFTTPRDYYTDWIKLGKPGWNPVTGRITLANGQQFGDKNLPITSTYTTAYASTPTFFITNGGTDNRSTFQIGAPGESPYWTMTRNTDPLAKAPAGALASTDPFGAGLTGIGLLVTGSSDTYTATQQPLYNSVARPIQDKSIYDWTKINLAGNSKAWDDVKIYLAQVDQIFLNTGKHTLAAQFTFMREDAKRLENQPMGAASVNSNVGQLEVDVNQVNLDGTPNPYYGRPFLKVSEPFLRDKPELWDTARGQAVYKIDFTKDNGWSKWLGTQQLLGYYEYKDQKNYNYDYRHTALGLDKGWEQKYAALNAPFGFQSNASVNPIYLATPPNPTTAGALLVPGNYARVSENYYVGSTPGGGIEYAPSYFPEGASVPFVWGPAGAMIKDVSAIGWTPAYGGGLTNLNEVIKTMGGVIQSNFLDNRLVGTAGLRRDQVYDRNSPLALLTPDLRAYDREADDQWIGPWRVAAGNTKTFSIVARPFKDIKFLNDRMNAGGIGKFFAEAVSSFSPTFNKSDNFIAQGPAYDLFLKKLPNQTGTGKDIGFWMTMMDGRLSIRYTHYDNLQLNLRNGDIATMAQRILRYEGFVSNDAYNLRSQATAWLNNLTSGGTASDDQIAAAIKMPVAQYTGLKAIAANNTYAAVNDMRSKGHELEINFNPTHNWTVSASVTKGVAINTAAGSAVDDYIAARMPIWTTLEDPRFSYVSSSTNLTTGVTTATYTSTVGPAPTVTSTITAANPVIPNGPGGHLLWWNIMGTPFSSSTLAGYNATSSPALNFLGNVDAPMAVFRALIGRPRPQTREYSAKLDTKYALSGITENKILKNMSVGASVRYASKGSIGFYGLGYTQGMDLTLASNKILKLDPDRPIYSPAETFVDLFVSYKTKLYHDKVRATFQLNVKNVGEKGGGLQATGAFFDGRAQTYRIVDPRQFVLTASFDL